MKIAVSPFVGSPLELLFVGKVKSVLLPSQV
jgi:hypothetical protein